MTINTQDVAAKLIAIVHIPTKTVRLNPKVESTRNTSETGKGTKLRSGKRLDDLPKQNVTGDTNSRRIKIDYFNHVQD